MNKETQLDETINSIVVDALEQMKTLKAEDRYNFLVELGEWIFCDPTEEEILLVPREVLQLSSIYTSTELMFY